MEPHPAQPSPAHRPQAEAGNGLAGAGLAPTVSEGEPVAGRRFAAPLWLIGLLALLLYWGQGYLLRNSGEFHSLVYQPGETIVDLQSRVRKSEADLFRARGRRIYRLYCAACHQIDGRGTPSQFPPLVQSEWVLAAGPHRLIRITLQGLQGPLTVKGQEYNNVMLAWRDQLTDEDIAAVLTYLRVHKAWGHNVSPVTPAQVKEVRAATVARGLTAWTQPELQTVPE